MEEQTCINCRYYMAHYVKCNDGFKRMNEGHCINGELHRRRSKRLFQPCENCEYWESVEIKTAERKTKIKNNLARIEEYLHEVLSVLKNEE